MEQEHQHINQLVTELERTSSDDPHPAALVTQVVELLRADVRDEEDVLLPRLQQALTARQLRGLGLAWELVRRTAPTRPHPAVSRRPPGNVVAALPLAVLDRARDRLDRSAWGLGARAAGRRRLSAALALAAVAVERVPWLQRGEHPSSRACLRSRRSQSRIAARTRPPR